MKKYVSISGFIIGFALTAILLLIGCSNPTSSTTPAAVESTDKILTGFSFLSGDNAALSSDAIGSIDQSAGTITLIVPNGTDCSALVADIDYDGDYVKIADDVQVSGSTENDFTSSVVYTVVAEDGSTKDYTAIVNVADLSASSEKEILSFVFEASNNAALSSDVTGVITGTDVEFEAPYGFDLSVALTPTISFSPDAIVSPASGTPQVYSTGDDVAYTVTAEDGSTQVFSVAVSILPNTDNQIVSFIIPASGNPISEDAVGVIDHAAGTIALTVPFGTALTSLTPDIELPVQASVDPASAEAGDFSTPNTYTVTAGSGDEKAYVVTVTARDRENGTITINLTGAAAANGKECGYIVLLSDDDPLDPDNQLAMGSTTISGGAISEVAQSEDINVIFDAGIEYDVYLAIDIDGDDEFGNTGDRSTFTASSVIVDGDVEVDITYGSLDVIPAVPGTITVDLSGASASVDVGFLIVPAGDAGTMSNALGSNGGNTDSSGAYNDVAQDEDDDAVDFTPGDYDVWLWVDDGDGLPGTGDKYDSITVSVDGDTEATFTYGTMADYALSPGTVTVNASDLDGMDGMACGFMIFDFEDDPDTGTPVASDFFGTVSGSGSYSFTTGNLPGGVYDVYFMIDVDDNGVGVPSPGDLVWGETAAVIVDGGNTPVEIVLDDLEVFGNLVVTALEGASIYNGKFCGVVLFEVGADPFEDDFIGFSGDVISDGGFVGIVMDDEGIIDFTLGSTYDVYLTVDDSGDYDPDSGEFFEPGTGDVYTSAGGFTVDEGYSMWTISNLDLTWEEIPVMPVE